MDYQPGQRVAHPEYGEGIVIQPARDGFIRVFFAGTERDLPVASLQARRSRNERVAAAVHGSEENLESIRLCIEAHALPLIESAAALTAAKIDLLPHQVVLTHRIATGSPRRYLVADEVGLGKTIETALLLRELASRGELKRALMVVPAGLVNNWHEELNEVFHLDFEVFGREGDVTDRRTNAFAKHDRLIASIDTLKRRERVKRLLEAPAWDLVVFDEAHHLTADRTGSKVRKTENFKLAEALKDHTRDLVFLSATPHQGDHFRFWMLVHMLNPTLFRSAADMVENRHRLNAVVLRRTKADACRPDGSPLFARRWVHTESFTMNDDERRFYGALCEYLAEGFALAQRQGSQGRALGFVMAIFQKIAASSFAAVRRTLRRRLIMLSVHEGILMEESLDIDGKQGIMDEARTLVRDEFSLGEDALGKSQADKVLADLKLRLLKKLSEQDLSLAASSMEGERAAAEGEEAVAMAVNVALPEERKKIRALLAAFPAGQETKVEKLLRGLGALWKQNPGEKVVIFATYLGTVELIGKAIDLAYPGQGVVVLRGGDHGAKLAAERRFKQPEGPRILVCTAAGREGLNLQVARILFNFDLPWNPMDVEQRIGRIHRYGQKDTAQVYNLVLSDTIEGRIFLLLNDKLLEIAKAVGKVDRDGNIAEDLRAQILGQLCERLAYDQLYRDALSDPTLRRTELELEAALTNADEARRVVFELFQELDGFSLDDYRPFEDMSAGFARIAEFAGAALKRRGMGLRKEGDEIALVDQSGNVVQRFTTDRDKARNAENLELLGLDHPLVAEEIRRWQTVEPENLGCSVRYGGGDSGLAAWWFVGGRGAKGEHVAYVQCLACKGDGERLPGIEKRASELLRANAAAPTMPADARAKLMADFMEPALRRAMEMRGLAQDHGGYEVKLLGLLEFG